jgi:hypothetical protein
MVAIAIAMFLLTFFSGGAALAQPADAGTGSSSTFTIEMAIDAAKQCVIDRKIHLAGSLIESARFERNPRGDRGPYWMVTWARAREVKGGQVFVAVFPPRTCEVTYGE